MDGMPGRGAGLGLGGGSDGGFWRRPKIQGVGDQGFPMPFRLMDDLFSLLILENLDPPGWGHEMESRLGRSW
jgi:hypothetical protein